MSIRVLFFASLAEITGMRETEVEALEHPDIDSIYSSFEKAYPRLRTHRSSLLLALNSEFAAKGTPVKDGDVVAFLPPVSGG